MQVVVINPGLQTVVARGSIMELAYEAVISLSVAAVLHASAGLSLAASGIHLTSRNLAMLMNGAEWTMEQGVLHQKAAGHH